MPSTRDRGAYQVGRDFAITPGAVVDRDPYAELIQYTPSTERVQARPVLIIPPPIGRDHFLDLQPGRSMVEYTVSRGLQAFMPVAEPHARTGRLDARHVRRAGAVGHRGDP